MRAVMAVAMRSAVVVLTACGAEPTLGGLDELATAEQPLQVTATFDAVLRVPVCAANASLCGTTTLSGRDTTEANRPNTLGGCADAPTTRYPAEASIDRVSVATNDGTSLQVGKTALVTVTFRPSTLPATDRVDVFSATDVANPVWSLVGTIAPTAGGSQTRTLSFSIGATGGSRRAVRAQVRQSFYPATPCSAALDADDLVFTLAGPPQLTNAGFEAGLTGWAPTGGVTAGSVARSGTTSASFVPVHPTPATITQRFQIPAGATTLSFWYLVSSTNSASMSSNLRVMVSPTSGPVLNVAFASNLSASPSWQPYSLNVAAMAGQVVTLSFQAQNQRISRENTFHVDELTVR
jgi:hypothetical protein